ncbi:MAG: hypothetical protein J6U22_03140 [Bacteroidaceae bacterium]|nr:hypothetical protein [Bacteroidaceae bacterium]
MTTQQFIFEEPLYKKVKPSENPQILADLEGYIKIDGYNTRKGVESTFKITKRLFSSYSFEPSSATEQIELECQRYGDHFYVQIHYDKNLDIIEKVGQYPSVADIQITQIKHYSKVLDEQYMKDFTKAIGLAANGVGTGSFVYLRRIFEHLVFEISRQAVADGEIDKNAFSKFRMDEKIEMLKNYLPDVLVNNKALYGVLSKGIHELSEDECLDYFSVVREIIELILDEFEFARKKAERLKQASGKLATVVGKVKK